MLVGLLLSLGAALATGIASLLQALAARRADHADVARLVVSPLYLGGSWWSRQRPCWWSV
jgi:ABC-type sugar transport system substrate-binding protein